MAKTEKKKTTKAAPVKAVPHPIPATSKEILAKAQTKIQAPVSTCSKLISLFIILLHRTGRQKNQENRLKKPLPKNLAAHPALTQRVKKSLQCRMPQVAR